MYINVGLYTLKRQLIIDVLSLLPAIFHYDNRIYEILVIQLCYCNDIENK